MDTLTHQNLIELKENIIKDVNKINKLETNVIKANEALLKTKTFASYYEYKSRAIELNFCLNNEKEGCEILIKSYNQHKKYSDEYPDFGEKQLTETINITGPFEINCDDWNLLEKLKMQLYINYMNKPIVSTSSAST